MHFKEQENKILRLQNINMNMHLQLNKVNKNIYDMNNEMNQLRLHNY